jgi:hypothetical protein
MAWIDFFMGFLSRCEAQMIKARGKARSSWGRLPANLGLYRAHDALHCARRLVFQRTRRAQERRWVGPTGRNMRTAQSFDVRCGFGPCLQPLSDGFTDWPMRRPGIALLLFEGASLVARV